MNNVDNIKRGITNETYAIEIALRAKRFARTDKRATIKGRYLIFLKQNSVSFTP